MGGAAAAAAPPVAIPGPIRLSAQQSSLEGGKRGCEMTSLVPVILVLTGNKMRNVCHSGHSTEIAGLNIHMFGCSLYSLKRYRQKNDIKSLSLSLDRLLWFYPISNGS